MSNHNDDNMYPPNPIRCSVPPAIMRGNGQTWIVAGCMIPVPEGTSRENMHRWVEYVPPRSPMDVWKVPSSTGGCYTVHQWSKDRWTCSCPGFKFHKRCKHVQQLQKTP